ncbi:unnamed protein product [Triticum turgidum subsp. durum]|uniref:Mitochondrial carrier protein n=1 Tax=Triticum turgidum subsp. durum TaxID=4567 RepID=A0A9R0SQ43_TRITD|nr:unnamed protein product [Triticum turgidum subsp. durum]
MEEAERGGWAVPLAVRELIAGGVAGGVAKCAVAPLERVKILLQTRRAEFRGSGLVGSFWTIYRTEGPLGFYRGNGASVARIVPYAALHYMAYEEYRRWIIHGFPNVQQGPVLDLVAGSIAGGTAVLSTYPLDLVRTKLAYQVKGAVNLSLRESKPSEQVYKGILDCLKTIYRQNGLKGLYRGMGMLFFDFQILLKAKILFLGQKSLMLLPRFNYVAILTDLLVSSSIIIWNLPLFRS